eukprot:911042-Amphidinium_carterae.1
MFVDYARVGVRVCCVNPKAASKAAQPDPVVVECNKVCGSCSLRGMVMVSLQCDQMIKAHLKRGDTYSAWRVLVGEHYAQQVSHRDLHMRCIAGRNACLAFSGALQPTTSAAALSEWLDEALKVTYNEFLNYSAARKCS